MSDVAILTRWVKILAALFLACVLLLAYVAWLKDWDLERRVRLIESQKIRDGEQRVKVLEDQVKSLKEQQRLQFEWNKRATGVQ